MQHTASLQVIVPLLLVALVHACDGGDPAEGGEPVAAADSGGGPSVDAGGATPDASPVDIGQALPDGGGADAGEPPVDSGAPDAGGAQGDACVGDGCETGAACPHGCGSHGTCSGGACACDEGFAGERCDACSPGSWGEGCTPCACEHGACLDGMTGTGACVCPAGFTGTACETEQSPPIPFDGDGPYGAGVMETAEDLVFPTLDGELRLSEHWTGHQSYLFLLRYAGSSYSKQIWSGNVAALLKRAPLSAVLVLGSLSPSWKEDVAEMKGRVDDALAAMSEEARASWAGRIVYVNVQASELPFATAQGVFMFAIDRFQRWREIGSLYDFATNLSPLDFLAHEAIYYDYEATLAQKRADLGATVVPVWTTEQHQGGWGGGYATVKTVELPSAAEMATYDSLAVHLVTSCPGHHQGKDKGCNEWDYIQDLRICDTPLPTEEVAGPCAEGDTAPCSCRKPDGTTVDATRACLADGSGFGTCGCPCNTELVRWVTPYGREGQWLTDVSPLLALLKDGGPTTFRFGGANGYLIDVDLLLWNAGTGRRPVAARSLWGNSDGEGFGEGYNDGKHPDVTFELPAGATGAAVYAVISGHGFGAVKENCAEFCNHQHTFTVNGKKWTKTHPKAGTAYGCRDQIADGVVPNQFGSWIFGRGGWCPGLDVAPWSADITSALAAENTISYVGLLGGKDYVPTVTDPSGYFPEIKMASWLIFYEDAP